MLDSLKDFFKRFSKKEADQSNSGEAAKERLHLVLMQDRASVSVDLLDMMKQEIIDDIKKYVDVDEKEIDVRLTKQINNDGSNGVPALYANIPIASIKNEGKKSDDITNTDNDTAEDELVKNSILSAGVLKEEKEDKIQSKEDKNIKEDAEILNNPEKDTLNEEDKENIEQKIDTPNSNKEKNKVQEKKKNTSKKTSVKKASSVAKTSGTSGAKTKTTAQKTVATKAAAKKTSRAASSKK